MSAPADVEVTPGVAELTRTVQAQRRTIDALIAAAERRTATEPDSAALATWQRNLTLQRRVVERTNRVQEAERLLRSVIDSLDAGMCILAADGSIIDTNRMWQEMLATVDGGHTYTGGSFFILSSRWSTGLGPLLREAAVSVGEVLAGRAPESSVAHRVLVRGNERWWKIRVDRVRGHDAAQAVVTLADATEQMRNQEELRQATRDAGQLALVARHMDDAVVIANADGVVEWVNDAFVEMSGFSRDEVVGRSRAGLMGHQQPLPSTEEYMAGGGQVLLPEFLTRTKNGRPYWLRVVLYRVVDDDGVVRLMAVERNVTRRRAAEETLLAAMEHSEALARELSTEKAVLTGVISSIPHLTYWKNSDGRYQGHNAAFLTMRGLPSDADLLGRTEAEIGAEDDVSSILAEIERQVIETGQGVVDQQITIPGAGGAPRSLLMSVLPQPGRAGHIGGLIGVGADVTRVSELERQLNQTNRLESIGQLAAGIAHEINTPIQFVSDNVRFVAQSFDQMLFPVRVVGEICARPVVEDANRIMGRLREAIADLDVDFLIEEVPGALTESLEGLDRVAQIVRAMKDFSHPGEGRRDTDINRAVESTIQVARNEWKYYAELDMDLGADVALIPCYEGEFKQVILNLIVNAAHAIEAKGSQSPGRGHIRVTTTRFADRVEVSIADDGIGMDKAVKDRIFDPFFTTKEVGKGTGQGLSMAYASIVQKHGGSIRVESAPGAGTTFVIVLPTRVDAVQVAL
jgi:two-component system NtrC family sensor kinase